jgi:hypothetical protein
MHSCCLIFWIELHLQGWLLYERGAWSVERGAWSGERGFLILIFKNFDNHGEGEGMAIVRAWSREQGAGSRDFLF